MESVRNEGPNCTPTCQNICFLASNALPFQVTSLSRQGNSHLWRLAEMPPNRSVELIKHLLWVLLELCWGQITPRLGLFIHLKLKNEAESTADWPFKWRFQVREKDLVLWWLCSDTHSEQCEGQLEGEMPEKQGCFCDERTTSLQRVCACHLQAEQRQSHASQALHSKAAATCAHPIIITDIPCTPASLLWLPETANLP